MKSAKEHLISLVNSLNLESPNKTISEGTGQSKGDVSVFLNISSPRQPSKPFLQKFCEVFGFDYDVEFRPLSSKQFTNSTNGDYIKQRLALKNDRTPKGVPALPIKVQAGYARHLTDPVYRSEMERVYFPNSPYDGDDYIYAQMEGDSMEYINEFGKPAGLEDGAWIIAQRVPQEDWAENLRTFYVHVVVTSTRLTIKRILQDNNKEIVLHADNEIYPQERISLSDVREIWIFKRKLDWNAPPPRKIEITV